MTNIRRALEAAAAVGGDAATYVEDVFSTYVYTGTGFPQGIENNINLGDFGGGTSTEFNGTSDYLSRTSDLAGNADGKTFTLSFWVYSAPQYGTIYSCSPGSASWKFKLERGSSSPGARIDINANNSSGSTILQLAIRDGSDVSPLPDNAWAHYLISVDLANTSNRGVYVNDVDYSSISDWDIYTDDSIDFTNSHHAVAAFTRASVDEWFKGRLAHVFLDYTYRDLSVTSNRRDFIDANGGSTSPATLSALNPIIYLPMTTGYSIGENLGTGGDFTSNGPPSIVNSGTEYEADSGDGGMVWIKNRTNTNGHRLIDTARGVLEVLESYDTTAETTESGSLTVFNSNGFTIGDSVHTNEVDDGTVSWTFRKAEKFFDIVTWTGNSVTGREISHNLGSVPGCIILKCTSTTGEPWYVYHRSAHATDPQDYHLHLNTTSAISDNVEMLNDTAPTSTVFTVSGSNGVNGSGKTYVAYLFAHDEESFGADEDESIIQCGSFSTSSSPASVNLGWEPQWLLVKNATTGDSWDNWFMVDNIRGVATDRTNVRLRADTSAAEQDFGDTLDFTATGFDFADSASETYIYMAIRRPMKVPEAGTEVFDMDTLDGTPLPSYKSDFVVDMAFQRATTGNSTPLGSRLAGKAYLVTDTTAAESANGNWTWDFMNGRGKDTGGPTLNDYSWMFRRAPGFFDVVCGNSDASGNVWNDNHSLGVAIELAIIKNRERSSSQWWTAQLTEGDFLKLNQDAAATALGTDFTSTTTTFQAFPGYLENDEQFIAYLFATLAGVSKVGSYTADATLTTIDCGFAAGARFVLIKRTDASGDWYYWDYSRGIVAGNDPYLLLNTNAAEVTGTDYIDPDNSGFQITAAGSTTINVDTGTYIFLAIA